MEKAQQKVVACIDGSPVTNAICDYAAWIAKTVEASLELLHTINHHETKVDIDLSGNIGLGSQEHLLEELTQVEQQHSKLLLQKGKLMLKAAKERALQAGVTDCNTYQRHGNLSEALIELEASIRVLVLGMDRESHSAPHLSSQLETVMRSLHRPMFIVNGEFTLPQQVMIAYDGSEAANKAVEMVANSPLFKTLTCHLVCVNKNSDTATGLLNAAGNQLTAYGIEVISTTLQGKTEQALCQYQEAQAIDLIVMGAFSHTWLHDFLLGSFTMKMLLSSPKPLLLLR